MDDVKNTQTAPAGLPEKEWFTLGEVAARWGTDKETILHYGQIGILRMSVETPDLVLNRHCITSDGKALIEVMPQEVVRDDGATIIELPKPYKHLAGVYVIPAETVSKAISLGKMTLGYLESTNDPNEFYPLARGQTVWVRKENLLVRKEELDAFERERGIGKYADTAPVMSAIPEETEVRRLQRTLAALVLGLASDGGKWATGQAPNVSAMVTVALKGVSDKSGKAPYGYGKTTLENTINAAVEACNSELNS